MGGLRKRHVPARTLTSNAGSGLLGIIIWGKRGERPVTGEYPVKLFWLELPGDCRGIGRGVENLGRERLGGGLGVGVMKVGVWSGVAGALWFSWIMAERPKSAIFRMSGEEGEKRRFSGFKSR